MSYNKTELYHRYRPQQFEDVVGQDAAVDALKNYGKNKKVPHALLFTGPSGCGKTTLARILRKKLKCHDLDFKEANSADFRGIDFVRDIGSTLNQAPLGGKCRVYLVDECHVLTKPAQEAFLKYLEDCPDHVYFFLATTDPSKLIKAVRTRCSEIKCRSLTDDEVKSLVQGICKQEEQTIDAKVGKTIVEISDGSARKALVLLDGVLGMDNVKEQLRYLEDNDSQKQAFSIAQALFKKETTWKTMAGILKEVSIPNSELEGVRYMILSYANKVLLSGNPRAALVIEEFRYNWYDSQSSGLYICCYNVIKDSHEMQV